MRAASWFCIVGVAVSACGASSPSSAVDSGTPDGESALNPDLAQSTAPDLASAGVSDGSHPGDLRLSDGSMMLGDLAVASCLAPKDCPAGAPICCLMGAPMTMTGSSACTVACAGMISNANVITTKACTTDADCVGYMGTAFGFTTAWTSCCSKTTTPAHFCLDPNYMVQGGYTCP